MNILVVGSGGREHALVWKLSQSKGVEKIFCAPGNGGISNIAENIDIKVEDIDGLLSFAKNNDVGLTVVGPEGPMVNGIVDSFESEGLKIFGVNKNAAQLEGSKDFAKAFMEKYKIPTARYETCYNLEESIKVASEFGYPVVIKADGLCLGKGVFICHDDIEVKQALESIFVEKVFGDEGNRVVIEEFLSGIEASLLCFVNGDGIYPLESAKDYKQIGEGNTGPNTGGVGCYSPSPLFDKNLNGRLENEILKPIYKGLIEEKFEYRGVIFIGLMIVDGVPKVLEFNVRFGDPETEVVLPRLKGDFSDLLLKVLNDDLSSDDLKWDDRTCVTVVLTSKGYPAAYEKGKEIILNNVPDDIIVFHNGTAIDNGKLTTAGGRVLSITTLAGSRESAANRIYDVIDSIAFEGRTFRRDIGLDYKQ
ncbi:MAG: phosphoribosylamine--glycine ligase [Tissierellia bacterium]|nr:phosphoribosylamine--glycine ligase [Tissierellia bacterium]